MRAPASGFHSDLRHSDTLRSTRTGDGDGRSSGGSPSASWANETQFSGLPVEHLKALLTRTKTQLEDEEHSHAQRINKMIDETFEPQLAVNSATPNYATMKESAHEKPSSRSKSWMWLGRR